jgi:hypothetical protein
MFNTFIGIASGTFGAAWFNTTCAAAMFNAFICFSLSTFGAS